MHKKRLDFQLQIKSVNDVGEFEAYGSAFGVKDLGGDIVLPGAFKKSLVNWAAKGALPALLWQHKQDEPIGIYTEMREDAYGLWMKGRLLVDADPLAKRAHAHMVAGSLTGFSIGYIAADWEFDSAKDAYLIKEAELWEVSLVTFPMNESARLQDVKNAFDNGEIPEPKKIEKLLREAGFSIAQAKTFMAKGYSALTARDVTVNDLIAAIKNA